MAEIWPGDIYHGDCAEVMREKLGDDTVDLIATDPPYGYSFMGREWDKGVPPVAVWEECLRVMKPGAFAFIMSTPRQDLLAQNIQNIGASGLDISFTSLYWAYTSGRPVAIDVGMAVDKRLGVEREVVTTIERVSGWNWQNQQNFKHGYRPTDYSNTNHQLELTRAASDEAKKLEGAYSGMHIKPAVESIIVAMKPHEGSGIDEAMRSGKGVTWLDDARIPFESEADQLATAGISGTGLAQENGRFPSNLISSGDVLATYTKYFSLDAWWKHRMSDLPKKVRDTLPFIFHGKAGIAEKGDYNTHPTVKPIELMAYLVILGSREGERVLDPFMGSGSTCVAAKILKRHYIGIDLSEEYIEIAKRRVREWQTVADLDVKRASRQESDFLDGYESDTFV